MGNFSDLVFRKRLVEKFTDSADIDIKILNRKRIQSHHLAVAFMVYDVSRINTLVSERKVLLL